MDTRLIAAVIFCGVLAASCGGSSPTTPTPTSLPNGVCGAFAMSASQPILNGTSCAPDTSSVVYLEIAKGGGTGAACSGTFIAPNAVLTAAHCLQNGTSVLVYLGNGSAIRASSFQAISSFNPNFQVSSTDVGVVILPSSVNRRTMPLLTSREAIPGEKALIAGFGRQGDGASGSLQVGTVTVTNVDTYYVYSLYNGGSTTSSTCPGDSGGPLVVSQAGSWAVAGVVSAGTSTNCSSTAEDVYARIRNSQILDFIRSKVPNVTEK